MVGMLPGACAEYTSQSMKTKVMHYSRTLINYAFLLHSAYLIGTPFAGTSYPGTPPLRSGVPGRKIGVPTDAPPLVWVSARTQNRRPTDTHGLITCLVF